MSEFPGQRVEVETEWELMSAESLSEGDELFLDCMRTHAAQLCRYTECMAACVVNQQMTSCVNITSTRLSELQFFLVVRF